MRRGCQANYAISLQAIKPMLHDNIGEDAFCADFSFFVQAHLIWSLKCQNWPWPIVYLKDVKVWLNLERVRIPMNEWVFARACIAIRCLYPEPRAASVEDELVGLTSTAEVDCRENLNVEEVRQVLLEEAWASIARGLVICSSCCRVIIWKRDHRKKLASANRGDED